MKKSTLKALALGMAMAMTTLASGSVSVLAEEAVTDTTSEKNFKILAIWPEDSAEGKILIGLTEQYIAEVNPNFSYEYEYVPSADVIAKVSTLVASNDLPDLFAYAYGQPIQDLISANKLVNISEALETLGCSEYINDAAKDSLLSLSNAEELYCLPYGMNIEGFWYNKKVFEGAGVSVPNTWDELIGVCDQLIEKGIQPIAVGGADRWPATRLVSAYAYRTMGADAVKKASYGEMRFDEEGFVKAASMIADMAEKKYFGEGSVTVDNTTAESMLLNGQCAMLYDGSWFTSSITNEELNPDGEENIGFMGVPVVDETVSAATELPTNCGNPFVLSADKYDAATAGWLQYFITNVGNYAMSGFQSLRGYTYTTESDELSPIVQEVVDTINSATSSTAWWEAYMDTETKVTAMNNIQLVLSGDMDGAGYCNSIQETYDLNH